MILRRQLAPGQRVGEEAIAEALGISRTPVRQALPVLAEEGLLVPAGARGFAVRAFTWQEIVDAVQIRGAIEGLAARFVAESGAAAALLAELRDCLADGDAVFADPASAMTEPDQERYSRMNGRFHGAIIAGAPSGLFGELLGRINRIPFVSPGAIGFDRIGSLRLRDTLHYAHQQHHAMVSAIANGQGTRVEALLREHVEVQIFSMNLRRPNADLPADAQTAPAMPPAP